MKRLKKLYAVIIILFAVIVLYNVGFMILQNANEQTYTVRVTDKMRVSYGHIWNSHKYLVFTVDDDTDAVYIFEDTDSIPKLKFDSSYLYAKVEVGKTYTLKTAGFRLPFFSKYKNIISIEAEIAKDGD